MIYFTIDELCKSETAKILNINNSPTSSVYNHLTEMVDNLLDPLRKAWGGPIMVTSGYRCPELNKAVRGSKSSVHMIGYAADLRPMTSNLQYFMLWVNRWLTENNVPFDQLIVESGCLHIGYKNNRGEQRKQLLDLSSIY